MERVCCLLLVAQGRANWEGDSCFSQGNKPCARRGEMGSRQTEWQVWISQVRIQWREGERGVVTRGHRGRRMPTEALGGPVEVLGLYSGPDVPSQRGGVIWYALQKRNVERRLSMGRDRHVLVVWWIHQTYFYFRGRGMSKFRADQVLLDGKKCSNSKLAPEKEYLLGCMSICLVMLRICSRQYTFFLSFTFLKFIFLTI